MNEQEKIILQDIERYLYQINEIAQQNSIIGKSKLVGLDDVNMEFCLVASKYMNAVLNKIKTYE